MIDQPQMCPTLFGTLDWHFHRVTVKLASNSVKEILTERYWSTVMAAIADEELQPETVGMVCQRLACLPPSKTWNELIAQIQDCLTESLKE